MLEVKDLTAGYGETLIVREVSLRLLSGRLTALCGANGAGKTTLLHAIAGLIRHSNGQVLYQGKDIGRLPAHARARLGIALVPEGRRLFAKMTVAENLEMGAFAARGRGRDADTLTRVYELFPRLKERQRQAAGALSGGEQQMLAVARGLMARPAVLIFDELTLGLSPALSLDLFRAVRRLKEAGLTMLLVEQNVHIALAISDDAYVLHEGRVWMSGEARTLASRPEFQEAFLGPDSTVSDQPTI
ncbi:MAG: ABC transporter ATP-binding protein [Myxococcales bacterium]|nr:ABC transporter ATP-binding protein [Myxococcales bacterium]